MALSEGTRVFVAYDVPPPVLFHERYVLAACGCGRGYHIVLTPDFDTYAEQFSPENDDIAVFRIAVGGQLPAGCNDGNTYRFRNLPDQAMMDQLRRDAAQAAAAMGGGVQVAAQPVAAGAVVAAGAGAVAEDDVWVRVETAGQHERGDIVELDGSEIVHGNLGLKTVDGAMIFIRKMKRTDIDKYKGAEAVGDARLLGLSFQGIQRAERQWRDVSKDVREEKMDD